LSLQRVADGQSSGYVHVFQECADLRTMEERLVQSERLATIGRFASQIAHEIRNPLSSISLNVELLAERVYIFDSITSMTIRKTPTILAVKDDTWSTIFNP